MELVTKLAVIAILALFMFAGANMVGLLILLGILLYIRYQQKKPTYKKYFNY